MPSPVYLVKGVVEYRGSGERLAYPVSESNLLTDARPIKSALLTDVRSQPSYFKAENTIWLGLVIHYFIEKPFNSYRRFCVVFALLVGLTIFFSLIYTSCR